MTYAAQPHRRSRTSGEPWKRLRLAVEALEHRFVMSVSIVDLATGQCSDQHDLPAVLLVTDIGNPISTPGSEPVEFDLPAAEGQNGCSADGDTDAAGLDITLSTNGLSVAETSIAPVDDLRYAFSSEQRSDRNDSSVPPSQATLPEPSRTTRDESNHPDAVADGASATEIAPPPPTQPSAVDITFAATFSVPQAWSPHRRGSVASRPIVPPDQLATPHSHLASEPIHRDYFASTGNSVRVRIDGEIVRDQAAVFLLGNPIPADSKTAASRTSIPNGVSLARSVSGTSPRAQQLPSHHQENATHAIDVPVSTRPVRLIISRDQEPEPQLSRESLRDGRAESMLLGPGVLAPDQPSRRDGDSPETDGPQRAIHPAGWSTAWRPWWQRVIVLGTGSCMMIGVRRVPQSDARRHDLENSEISCVRHAAGH